MVDKPTLYMIYVLTFIVLFITVVTIKTNGMKSKQHWETYKQSLGASLLMNSASMPFTFVILFVIPRIVSFNVDVTILILTDYLIGFMVSYCIEFGVFSFLQRQNAKSFKFYALMDTHAICFFVIFIFVAALSIFRPILEHGLN